MNDDQNPHILLRLASQRPFLISLAGTLLLLLAFPPVGWWMVAWLALIPTMGLVATPNFQAKHPWRSIWFSGWVFWALEAYYISIPHPALWIAWILLFSYLSVYPLLFVWISRKLVHGHGVSVLIATPIVFTALEWVRAHALTGFGFSMLANSQYKLPLVLQICDVAGAYGLTFLMVAFAAGLFLFLTKRKTWGLVTSLLIVGLVAGYGWKWLKYFETTSGELLNVAVMQGNIDTRFPGTEQEAREIEKQRFEEYLTLQTDWQSANNWPLPSLIIWPEGKYPVPHVLPGGGEEEEMIRRDFRLFYGMLYEELVEKKKWEGQPRLPAMIVGGITRDPANEKFYNSALMLGNQGSVQGVYHKIHLVPFGEFVPFVEWFPILAEITPIGSGIDAGQRPAGFEIGKFVGVPCICFESAVTHRVRESVMHMRTLDKEPGFLVNITDDGWFYGHAVLDHHLACNVMRAVENRKPMIVAANTGFSAFIQSDGRILQQGPRRKSEVLEADFELKSRRSLYTVIGDWPAILLTILCVMGIVIPPRKKLASDDVNEKPA